MPPTLTGNDLPQLQDYTQQHYPHTTLTNPYSQVQQSPPSAYTSAAPTFVSPSMWRDTVASTFDPGGLKRRWDPGAPHMNGESSKRMR